MSKNNKKDNKKKGYDKKNSKPKGRGKHPRQNDAPADPKIEKQFDERANGELPDYKNSTNDPSWYLGTAGDTAVAKLSFNNPQGHQFNYFAMYADDSGEPRGRTTVSPGVFRVGLTSSPGTSRISTDPLNVASRQLYSFVRYWNTGSRNYEQTDLFMMVVAAGEAIKFLSWMQRLYGALTIYTQTNRYFPVGIVHAMGGDVDDLVPKMSSFYTYITNYTRKISSLPLPKLPYYAKCAGQYANIYLETPDTIKTQTYLFDPDGFLVWSPRTNEKGSELKLKIWNYRTTPRTLEEIMDMGNSILTPLTIDEDVGIMGGDLKKAYGDESLLYFSELPQDYTVNPIYDPAILYQIKNSICQGAAAGPDVIRTGVFQSDGNIICNAVVTKGDGAGNVYSPISTIVLSGTDNPTPEEVMESTRYIALARADVENAQQQTAVPINTGGDYVSGYSIITFNNDTRQLEIIGQPIGVRNLYTINPLNHENYRVALEIVALLSRFKFSPAISWYVNAVTGETEIAPFSGSFILNPCIQLDNYAELNRDALDKMNQTAMLNLFATPLWGSSLKKPI